MQPQMSNNTCDILLCHYLSTKIKPKCGKLWEKPSTLLLYPQELGRRKETASACISIQADLLEVWSVQVCVNPVPSRKDTSNDLNE